MREASISSFRRAPRTEFKMPETPALRIGNQSALSAPTLLRPFEYAVESGFDAFEWLPDRNGSGAGWDESSLDRDAREYIKRTARAHDIRLSVHAPWTANPLDPQAQPILLRQIDLARDIGAAVLNIHLYTESGMDAYVRAIAPILKRLSESDIKLAGGEYPAHDPQALQRTVWQDSGIADRRDGRSGHVPGYWTCQFMPGYPQRLSAVFRHARFRDAHHSSSSPRELGRPGQSFDAVHGTRGTGRQRHRRLTQTSLGTALFRLRDSRTMARAGVSAEPGTRQAETDATADLHPFRAGPAARGRAARIPGRRRSLHR